MHPPVLGRRGAYTHKQRECVLVWHSEDNSHVHGSAEMFTWVSTAGIYKKARFLGYFAEHSWW